MTIEFRKSYKNDRKIFESDVSGDHKMILNIL